MIKMGIAPIEYFDTFKEAMDRLPELQKEWGKVELIVLKEEKGNYSICTR